MNNTGIGTTSALSSVPVQSSASVYLAIGESIPSPAPETISEVRVNTSMYDAQQGGSSGAHIDMSTASGTNNIHGTAYVHRGTNWLNADPYFFNADPNIPLNEKNPELHRYTAGGAIGLPIKKDKLFFYGSYQYTHASDQEIGISRAFVPLGLGGGRAASGHRCMFRPVGQLFGPARERQFDMVYCPQTRTLLLRRRPLRSALDRAKSIQLRTPYSTTGVRKALSDPFRES